MSITLTVSDSVARSLRLPAGEAEGRLRCELALSLYAQGILSFGKATELSAISRWQFADLVARRGIPSQPHTFSTLPACVEKGFETAWGAREMGRSNVSKVCLRTRVESASAVAMHAGCAVAKVGLGTSVERGRSP